MTPRPASLARISCSVRSGWRRWYSGIRSGWSVSGTSEEVAAFLRGEGLQGGSDPVPGTERSPALRRWASSFAKDGSIGLRSERVRRQQSQFGAARLDRFAYARHFVGGQIVHRDDLPCRQGRHHALLDISYVDFAVHRRIDDEWRGDGVTTQRRHERCHLPVSVRHLGDQPLSARGMPRSLVMLVDVLVSSTAMKMSLADQLRLLALPLFARAARTSLRSCSAACRLFFEGEAVAVAEPPHRTRRHHDAPPRQPSANFLQRQVRLVAISLSSQSLCASSGERLPPMGFAANDPFCRTAPPIGSPN